VAGKLRESPCIQILGREKSLGKHVSETEKAYGGSIETGPGE
jgi:hypothetical protein